MKSINGHGVPGKNGGEGYTVYEAAPLQKRLSSDTKLPGDENSVLLVKRRQEFLSWVIARSRGRRAHPEAPANSHLGLHSRMKALLGLFEAPLTTPVEAVSTLPKAAHTPAQPLTEPVTQQQLQTGQPDHHHQGEMEAQVEGFRRTCSTRKLQAAWRTFSQHRRATAQLAQAFVACGATRLPPAPYANANNTNANNANVNANGGVFPGSGADMGSGDKSGHTTTTSSSSAGAHTGAGSAVLGPFGAASASASPASPASSPPGPARGSPGASLGAFDSLAATVQSPATLRAATALLRRLEARWRALHRPRGSPVAIGDVREGGGGGEGEGGEGGGGHSDHGVTHSLSRLFPGLPRGRVPHRYPARVLLCAYMALQHPEVVFGGFGEREAALTDAARDMVEAFEALLACILHPPASPAAAAECAAGTPAPGHVLPVECAPSGGAESPTQRQGDCTRPTQEGRTCTTMGQRLDEFDAAWGRYLGAFAAWKLEDAAALEAELIGVACEMERSLTRKLALSTPSQPPSQPATAASQPSPPSRAGRDLPAIQHQVARDHALLRARLEKVGGAPALQRLDTALAQARAQALASAARVSASGTGSSSRSSSQVSASDLSSSSSASCSEGEGGETGATTGVTSEGRAAGANEAAAVQQASGLASPSSSPAQPSQHAKPLTVAPAATPAPPPPRVSASGLRRGFFGSTPSSHTTTAPATPPTAQSAPPAHSPQAPHQHHSAAPTLPPHLSPGGGRRTPADALALSNLHTVHELVMDPGHNMGTAEAEAAWARARAAVTAAAAAAAAATTPDAAAPGESGAASCGSSMVGSPQDVGEAAGDGAGAGGRPSSACVSGREGRDSLAERLAALVVAGEEGDGEEEGGWGHLSVEEVVGRLRARAKAVAEEAFWDACAQRIQHALITNALGPAVAPLVSDIGLDLADVVSDGAAAAKLRSEFAEQALEFELSGDAGGAGGAKGVVAALEPVVAALQRLAALLLQYGAPVREEEAKQAGAEMRAELGAALAAATPVLLARHATHAAGAAAGQPAPLSPPTPSAASPPAPTPGPGSSKDSEQAAAASAAAAATSAELAVVFKLAGSLARALRLLMAQLKLLKVDAANVRLAALAQQVRGEAGVHYLRSKFAALHGISGEGAGMEDSAAGVQVSGKGPEQGQGLSKGNPHAGAMPAETVCPDQDNSIDDRRSMRVAAALPRTLAWLRGARAGAQGVRNFLAASGGLPVDAPPTLAAAAEAAAQAVAAATAAAPLAMRSGLRAAPSSSASTSASSLHGLGAGGGAAMTTAAPQSTFPPSHTPPSIAPLFPVPISSWRGALRTGIVALISGDAPAASPALAETLGADAARLHAAQNQFQQLVVVTACLLLVGRTRAQAGRPALAPARMDAARKRLQVLLADPSMSGPGPVVSEMARFAREGVMVTPAPTPVSAPAPAHVPSPAADSTPAAETSHHSGCTGSGEDAGSDHAQLRPQPAASQADEALAEEEALGRAFKTLMSPGGPGYMSLAKALAAAASVHLLLGPAAVAADAGGAGRAVDALLGRVGARALAGEVGALAGKLGVVCGVSEAVHGPLYDTLMQHIEGQEEAAANVAATAATVAATTAGDHSSSSSSSATTAPAALSADGANP